MLVSFIFLPCGSVPVCGFDHFGVYYELSPTSGPVRLMYYRS